MPTKHVTYGGSTIGRTIACPAWIQLAAQVPKRDTASEAAIEGTLLHNAMEYIMDQECFFEPQQARGWTDPETERTITQEHVDESLVPAYETINGLMQTFDVDEYILEPYVDIADDIGGSIDFLAVGKHPADGKKTIIIADYKFGYHPVEAINNSQLLFYALNATLSENTRKFVEGAEHLALAIIQPTKEDGALSLWIDRINVLDQFEDAMTQAISESKSQTPSCRSGSHCKYCPAQPICPVKAGLARQAKNYRPDQLMHLSDMLELIDHLEDWIRDVKKTAHEQLEHGNKIEGYKLVEKRATRKWTDPATVRAKAMKSKKLKASELDKVELISPAQFEKLCKKKGVDLSEYTEYITSTSTGTTLAHESDKRPAVDQTVQHLEALVEVL